MIRNGTDNRLDFMDQASFLGLRATGQGQLGQVTWVYDRGVNHDGLRRFHDNLRRGGLLGRRVERSPLPFGRHRWVACGDSSGIDIAAARPRADLSAWLDERAQVPVDPEFGPAWHLGVLPLEGGGAASTLVASHTVVDGLGMCLAIADAANGVVLDLGYPPPRSRPRRTALAQDLRQTVRGVPEVGRALRAAVRLARQERRRLGRPRASAPVKRSRPLWDPCVVVPSATAYIDVGDWDDRAALLGGTTNALFAGFAALFAARVGRVRAGDGAVTLSFPVSERTDGDARANALSSVDVKVDPNQATVDLTGIRSAVKRALSRHRQQPNDFLPLLPLTPLVPRRAATRLAGVAFAYDELPVGCSNVGALDPAVGRIDGSDADLVSVRLVEQGVRRSSLEQIGGQLFFACGRIAGKVFIAAVGYQPGMENSKQRLRELLVETLKDFDLTGVVE